MSADIGSHKTRGFILNDGAPHHPSSSRDDAQWVWEKQQAQWEKEAKAREQLMHEVSAPEVKVQKLVDYKPLFFSTTLNHTAFL